MKPLDKFDWSFPRAIDRPRYEQLLTLPFTARGENVLPAGRAASARARSPRTSANARSKQDVPSASRASTLRFDKIVREHEVFVQVLGIL